MFYGLAWVLWQVGACRLLEDFIIYIYEVDVLVCYYRAVSYVLVEGRSYKDDTFNIN